MRSMTWATVPIITARIRLMSRARSIAFGRWQVESSGTNVLDLDHTPERIIIKFQARVITPIRKGQYFVTLRDGNNTIVWSKLHCDLRLDPGPMTFVHEFKSLPLLPGAYTWGVGVNDGHRWFDFVLTPELSIVSNNDSYIYGHLKGFLNLASGVQIEADDATPATAVAAKDAIKFRLTGRPSH